MDAYTLKLHLCVCMHVGGKFNLRGIQLVYIFLVKLFHAMEY